MDDEYVEPDLTMFIFSAAHDMKNSVSSLNGVLEKLLLDETIKATPVYKQISHMLYETGRMNNNLIQLLALYKEVGTASYPFDLQSHELENFVDEIATRNQILLDAKDIAFYMDCPPGQVWYFDEDLVLGVIGHAINNAIHYTVDKIGVFVVENGDFLEIRVEDNGRGYPPAMIDAANPNPFGPRKAVNFMTNSTGLGLHFSAEVAKMHKHRGRVGSMRLENGGEWGGGCFVLSLP